MNFFEDIYTLWCLGRIWWKWHQNWWWNNEMGILFWHIVKSHFDMHVNSMEPCRMYCILLSYLHETAQSIYRKISAWAASVHSSMGTAPLVLHVCKIFDCLSKKGLLFSIWASILMPLSPHHPKISCFINIVK